MVESGPAKKAMDHCETMEENPKRNFGFPAPFAKEHKVMQDLLIVWTDINDTGITIIDQQHRGIVSAINSLFFFIQNKDGQRILAPTVSMIEQYTKIHFATEEMLLERTKYPDVCAHKKLHSHLIRKSIVIGSESRRDNDPSRYLAFMKEWWVEHINHHDQRYAEHLHNHFVLGGMLEGHAPAEPME